MSRMQLQAKRKQEVAYTSHILSLHAIEVRARIGNPKTMVGQTIPSVFTELIISPQNATTLLGSATVEKQHDFNLLDDDD